MMGTLKGLWLGMVYAVQGTYLVLQNPMLRQKHHLRLFLQLSILSFLLVGVAHILVGLPIHLLRLFFWMLSPSVHLSMDAMLTSCHSSLHDLIGALPFVLLFFMRYLYPQPLDTLFMEALVFVEKQQHLQPQCLGKQTKKMNQLTFAQYLSMQKKRSRVWQNMKDTGTRTWNKVRLGLILYVLSMIPYFGLFVFPLAGGLATFKTLGPTQGCLIGLCFLYIPSWSSFCIRGLLGMRVLMRELLEPYFSRMGMTHQEKRQWCDGRRDILFGFSAMAYLLIQIVPIFNFLAYGVIQASASYMVLMTDPYNHLPSRKRNNI
ncbi:uncharacterized protein BX664DRAFT_334491 [Halteromyces radiatus]|uniref:uncharacterized protein n=1 Tax=Halteromyces radiatus TaxID=101107 RepID=UPI00221FC919|nr:uncharacterized protein BX664DRAFT_334491 [Halteromyces radiatus]KAI8090015.1 hypothetical protein BX664DRAFT_334491 [Halteromyces radiatus]